MDKFTDLMVKDSVTGEPHRADKLLEDLIDDLLDKNPTMPQVRPRAQRRNEIVPQCVWHLLCVVGRAKSCFCKSNPDRAFTTKRWCNKCSVFLRLLVKFLGSSFYSVVFTANSHYEMLSIGSREGIDSVWCVKQGTATRS